MTKHLSRLEMKALDRANEILVSRTGVGTSMQPRFRPKTNTTAQFFFQIYNWTKEIIFEEPKYSPDNKKRDTWLQKVVAREPYLMGVLQSVISVDKNRGWTIIGGRNQVRKYTEILHNFVVSPDVYGWRAGMSVTSQSYYQSDIGAIVEIARTGKNGGLAGMFSVDSTKCSLTGDLEFPLKYIPASFTEQKWDLNDYFRVASMPSTEEKMNGLGWCAISRCIELSKLMVSVFEHDKERMGSKAPKGILLINGITQAQWLESLEESGAALESLERQYYSGVQVIAGDGITPMTASLVPLSNLPESFDHKTFTDMLIYGYALAFGYDPREFWPISGGMVGYGAETTVQHKKATGKGGMDFILGIQEKIQEELPETVDFEFEQRDVDGEMSDTALKQAQLAVVTTLFSSVNGVGEILVSQSEARNLLAEQKLIPSEWTQQDEEIEIEDTEDEGTMLEKARVRNAMQRFPNEDIVQYSWPSNKTRVIQRANSRPFQMRVKKSDILYKDDDVTITKQDVTQALAEARKRLGKRAAKYI